MAFALVRFLLLCFVLLAVAWVLAALFSKAPPPARAPGAAGTAAEGTFLQKAALPYALRHAGGFAAIAGLAYALGYVLEQDWPKAAVFGALGTVFAGVAAWITRRRPWMALTDDSLVWKPPGGQPPLELPWRDIEEIALTWNHWLTGGVIIRRRRTSPSGLRLKAGALGLPARELATRLRARHTAARRSRS